MAHLNMEEGLLITLPQLQSQRERKENCLTQTSPLLHHQKEKRERCPKMNLAASQTSWVQDPTISQTEDHPVLDWAVPGLNIHTLDQAAPDPDLTLDLLVSKLSPQPLCREWQILINVMGQVVAQTLSNQEHLQLTHQAPLTTLTPYFMEH